MDLNQLYFDHQILLMRAQRAGSAGGRRGHAAAATGVAAFIGRFQTGLGAPAAAAWLTLAAETPAITQARAL